MSGQKQSLQLRQNGFTIVELLIVIVVITILAAVTIVTYNGVSKRAAAVTIQSDLRQISDQLGTARVDDGSYPLTNTITPNTYFKHSDGTNLEYTSTDGTAFCVTASSTQAQDNYYFDSGIGKVQQGKCSGHIGYTGAGVTDGTAIQTITSANCPTTLTRAVDARDNNTYWVQKLADGKCWMLTNLAYAGGGTNTYGDVKSLTYNSTSTYTAASYYIPTNANPSSGSTSPSSSKDGGATSPQYGYLYNWCAAMGGQATAACAGTTTPTPNASISICPTGWRLPTGDASGELVSLNNSVNGGSLTSNTGLNTNWLEQLSGYWATGTFNVQGAHSYYWSSTQHASSMSFVLSIASNVSTPTEFLTKSYGAAVRCVAQ